MKWLPSSLLVFALLALGGGLLYALGQWDSAESAKWKAHEAAVTLALRNGNRYREVSDSLRRGEQAAIARAEALTIALKARTDSLDKMQAEIEREVEVSTSATITDLLAGLRLRPIGDGQYATDSAGVRFLEALRLEALKAPMVPILWAQAADLVAQRDSFREAALLAGQRADSADSRVIALENLLKEGQKLRRCRVAFVIPCPSRGLSYVLGGVTAIGIVVASN